VASIYIDSEVANLCKDLNIGLLTRFLRHIMCTTTAIECRTLQVIFISIVDHWSYFQSSWDGNDNDHIDVVSLLFLFLVLLYVQSFLLWVGTRPSVWFFRDRKIEGLSSILFPLFISFLTRYSTDRLILSGSLSLTVFVRDTSPSLTVY